MGTLSHIRRQLQTITKSSLSSKMFKIAIYIVATLALAQKSHGLKCYTGTQTPEYEGQLTETNCTTTDCVKTEVEIGDQGKGVFMYCDGSAPADSNFGTALQCSSQKEQCVEQELLGIKQTVCCCSADLCNGVGVSGLSGALALALVAAIFWGQN